MSYRPEDDEISVVTDSKDKSAYARTDRAMPPERNTNGDEIEVTDYDDEYSTPSAYARTDRAMHSTRRRVVGDIPVGFANRPIHPSDALAVLDATDESDVESIGTERLPDTAADSVSDLSTRGTTTNATKQGAGLAVRLATLTPRYYYNRVQTPADLDVYLGKPMTFDKLTLCGRVCSSLSRYYVFVEVSVTGSVTGSSPEFYIIIADGYFEACGIIFEVKGTVHTPSLVDSASLTSLPDFRKHCDNANRNKSIRQRNELACCMDSVRELLLFIKEEIEPGEVTEARKKLGDSATRYGFAVRRIGRTTKVSSYTRIFYNRFGEIYNALQNRGQKYGTEDTQANVSEVEGGSHDYAADRVARLSHTDADVIEIIRAVVDEMNAVDASKRVNGVLDMFTVLAANKLGSLLAVADRIETS